jgi:hypothetical protein
MDTTMDNYGQLWTQYSYITDNEYNKLNLNILPKNNP